MYNINKNCVVFTGGEHEPSGRIRLDFDEQNSENK